MVSEDGVEENRGTGNGIKRNSRVWADAQAA